MKHILTILLITLISLGVSAQSSSAFDYHHFLVDGEDHFQVIADQASSFGFYSQTDGGKLLQLSVVNNETNTFKDFSIKPAFVICLDEQRREKIYGWVEFTEPFLFHLHGLPSGSYIIRFQTPTISKFRKLSIQ